MKLLLTAVLSCGALLCAQGQQMSANYSLTEVGPNHRVWQAPPDPLTGQTHAPVVELRSGMNYWDPDQAAWLPSQPSFVDTGDAFVASRIQHKTRLERDINVEGAVSFLTPSGSTIRATPVGIALYNRINGQFALIGTLTNSTGAIVGPGADTVLYEEAYAGVVCASVAYRVAHGSLEQDVIFTGKLDVGAYNFPTNNNTLVQVISEIYESPAPDITRNPVYVETNLTVRSRMASPDIMDETIAYDEHFFLGRGHAYTAPSSANTNGTAAVVSKELCITPNGTFLIESVQYGAIRDALAALPDCVPTGGHASLRPGSGLENFCAILPKPPSAAPAKLARDRKPEKLASATRLPAGVVVDFVANVAQNQPLFACDTNYIVSGAVNINVATTFEGGTVVKYQTGACLNLCGAVTCATALYRPVTLTAYDDNTVGEPVGSGNVSPNGYANPAIYMGASTLSLTNFHIRYAQVGIMSFGAVGTSLTVNDSQFVKCIQGIHIGGTGCGCGCGCGCGSLTVVLNNTLMATTTYPLCLSAGSCILNVGFYNCTVDHGSQVINGSYAYAVNVVSTNSSFTCNTSKGLGTYSGYKNGFYGNTGNWTFGTAPIQPSSSPYQIAGAGSYYLAVSSVYRNAGSVNIGPGLLADLHQRTTDPPNITYANVPISTATTFPPQVQRDSDPPDVGYHYDPLDYAVSGLTVTATLSLINGVAVATYGTTAAISLSGSGQLLSQGLANNLNHVVRYNTVQEQSSANWSSSTVGDAVSLGSANASAQCTFTAWSLLGAVGNHVNDQAYYTTPSWFAHNQFAGGQFTMHPGLVALTNCLWERVELTLNDNLHQDTWYLYNNLFRGGNLTYSLRGAGSVGKAYDNLFDRTAITRLSSSGFFASDYNGYVVNCNQFENSGANNRVLSSNPDYQSGPFGRYYYPTSGNLLNTLINAGSRQAVDAGLYSFTTTTNQAIEGSSQVDIGFHYVALDSTGNPLDSDGDGIPDYIPTAPTIITGTGPLSQTVYWGDSVTFSVQVHGSPPFSYQWKFTPEGGTAGDISGATGSSLTLNNVDYPDGGSYSVQVFNLAGSTVSSSAVLTIPGRDNWPVVTVVGPRQDYTFKNGFTYNIASRVELYGVTTIQGGSVIKFDYTANSTLAIMGTLACKTDDPFVPAFLTSVDDISLGRVWGPPRNFPQAANNGVPYLDLASAQDASPSLTNLRIRYADQGATTPAGAKWLDLWDCQFLECKYAVVAGQNATAAFHNVLLGGCGAGVKGAATFAAIIGEHLTADTTDFWVQAQPSRIALTNSLVFGNLAGGPTLTTDHSAVNPAGAVFQQAGAGIYYLASASPYRRAGTAAVSPRLLAEFQQKSTQPPMELPAFWQLNGELTLGPQVQRYTSGPPDYGFYYMALDYTVVALLNSGTITVLPGTTIGFRNDSDVMEEEFMPGFDVWEGSSFASHGTPNKPIVFVDVQAIQEQYTYACSTFFDPDFYPNDMGLLAPWLDLRFCNSYAQPQYWHVWSGNGDFWDFEASCDSLVNWNLQDCALHNGAITLGEPNLGVDGGPPDYWVYGSCAVAWTNNLFDNVAINLDPTLYEYAEELNLEDLNCDFAFAAYNNLFRGGLWFHLEPVPATVGDPPSPANWVFKDNLFDKVNFIQDTEHCPLDFDHNGYCPLPDSELPFAWDISSRCFSLPNASKLLTGTGGEESGQQILPAPPPYQTGPLGNYYLPSTTQLSHAGSRTADAAGLFHYTTNTNQTKEGSGQMVNIGLHYIATASSTSTSPKDTDGDGIPDFVENWHGDGDTGLSRVHTEDETDWNNPTTDTDPVTQLPIADSANTKYDDTDLSGSGLVGRVKSALGLGPFDSSNPLTLEQLTTTDAPEIVTFRIPVNYSVLTSIGGMNLNRSGSGVTLGSCEAATDGCHLVWNTAYDAPGFYLLQARLLLNGAGGVGVKLDAVGPVVLFQSHNVLQFFSNGSMYDDTGAYIDAQLSDQFADYTIDLYDPSTSPPTLIKSIANSTFNGLIQEDWGVTNADGTLYTGDSVNAVFDVTLLDAPGGTPTAHGTATKPLQHAQGALSEDGVNFDVIYMALPDHNGQLLEAFSKDGNVWNYMQGIVDVLTKPDMKFPFLYNSDLNPYTGSGRTLFPGYIQTQDQITDTLLPDFKRGLTRQFFADTHGTDTLLADHLRTVELKAEDVGDALKNGAAAKGGFWWNKPFRFVFLNGCSTGSTPDWRQAFGIQSRVVHRNNIGPQAYVGWEKDHSGGYAGVPSQEDYYEMQNAAEWSKTMIDFFTDWMQGTALALCILHASDPTIHKFPFPVEQQTGNDKITIAGKTWKLNRSKIFVVGHSGITCDNWIPSSDGYYFVPGRSD